MIIAVDFDGTCVTHNYPEVGADIGAQYVLKKLSDKSHKIILYTMRSSGKVLEDAINWFKSYDIPLYGVNKNPGQVIWSKSPKVYANLYIDDAALGVPLINMNDFGVTIGRPYAVDWRFVAFHLYEAKLLTKDELELIDKNINELRNK